MIKKKIIHDHRLSYEDDDQIRSGAHYLEEEDADTINAIFKEAKERKIADFRDEEDRKFQLIYMGALDGYGHYMLVRKGHHNDSSSWF